MPRTASVLRMQRPDTTAWLAEVRTAIVKELSALSAPWEDSGELVLGPGTTAVIVRNDHPDAGPGHVDIGFVLNRNRGDAPIIWDCAAGGEGDLRQAATFVSSLWVKTTAATVLELLTQRGEYAEHSDGEDGLGLKGWHTIHGPILGYGRDDARPLQTWCVENPVVPLLGDLLAAALPPGPVHGVKFLLGAFDEESIAEVRIDGAESETCSDALLKLDWPKQGAQVARFFVLFIQPRGT